MKANLNEPNNEHNDQHNDQRHLYNDLTWAWQIIGPPEDYVEETEFFAQTIKKKSERPVNTILHMCCGAGGNDFTLKKHFKVTGVDMSESMLAIAKKTNPEASYHLGNMKSVRLGETFDAVTILDAIDYNRSEDDIGKTFETAFAHLEPGGVFLTVIEYIPETFPQNATHVETRNKDGIEVTYIENTYDIDTTDNQFEATFLFISRKDGKQEIHTDRHTLGLFPLDTWTRLLKETGFDVEVMEFKHSSFKEGESLPMLVGVKPG